MMQQSHDLVSALRNQARVRAPAALIVAAILLVAARAEAVVQGIDVSHWQGSINWTAVRNAGIQFAFCKVSDGVGDFDATYSTNLNGAAAAGVLVGPYHFAYPQTDKLNPLDAANEANYFVDLIQPFYQSSSPMLRPVLDLETLSGQGSVAAERAFLSNWVRNFSAVVENRLGVKPIVYTTGGIAQNYLEMNINEHPLWFAKPTTTNDYNAALPPTIGNIGIWGSVGWDIWQWSHTGSLGGISPVDRDVFNGTLIELAQQFSPTYSNGDYNNNGIVDAADYVVWRKAMGQSVNPGVGADGNLNGIVDEGDFAVWQANFGNEVPNVPAGDAGAGSAVVPEPSSLILFWFAAAAAAAMRREF